MVVKDKKTAWDIVPEIIESVEEIDHYSVDGKLFLDLPKAKRLSKKLKKDVIEHYNSVKIYEVDSETFINEDEALKKQKSLTKKNRDKLREAVRAFGVYNISKAEKIDELFWLFNNYSVDDVFDTNFFYIFNRDDEDYMREFMSLCMYDLPKDTPNPINRKDLSVEHLFNNYDFHNSINKYETKVFAFNFMSRFPDLNIRHVNMRNEWRWLNNYDDLIDFSGSLIPDRLATSSPERRKYIEEQSALDDKCVRITDMLDFRVAELLYLKAYETAHFDSDGNVEEVLPLEDVAKLINVSPIVQELEDIIDFLHDNENGADFHIKVINGANHYWLYGDKAMMDPFKKF